MFIAYRYPKAPLLGLGFSLGANVMTRYIAEEGHCSRLVSGCALGCVSSPHLSDWAINDRQIALGLETK